MAVGQHGKSYTATVTPVKGARQAIRECASSTIPNHLAGHTSRQCDLDGSCPLANMGVGYSYTIYLNQQLTKALIDMSKHTPVTSSFMNSQAPQVSAFVGGSLVLGWALSLAVERPGLVLRERLVPR